MKSLTPSCSKMAAAFALVLSLAVWIACGSGGANNNGNSNANSPGTLLVGNWSITISDSSYPDSIFNANLVPGPCTVTTVMGVYGEDTTYCFVASNNGQGSLSGAGWFFYSPTEVIVNTAEVFTPTNPTIGLAVILLEGDPEDGNFSVFSGSGTLTVNGEMSGSWMCAYGPCTVTLPGGGITSLGGAFTGSKN